MNNCPNIAQDITPSQKRLASSRVKFSIFILVFLLLSLRAFALSVPAPQKEDTERITITGDVRDRLTSGQLVGAQLRVFNSSDSLVGEGMAENYIWSNFENGMVRNSYFNIKIPHVKDLYILEVSYDNYDTLYHTLSLNDMGRREFSRAIGTLYMDRLREEHLKEVTVTASKVKFYNRGDTLVYNADAFQLADGSMLDALVKQLPGVELKSGGQIYVNGEYVEELLLNGRDFFKGDNKIMLDNLGAYTVKNIEVYKKTDEYNAFIGNNSELDKKLVMDVKIKKEYMGGWNFNLEAGLGTQERYLGRLFGMHFTASNQFSLYANVNNLNDSRSPSSDNEWNPAVRPEGTKDFREAGFSYYTEQSSNSRQEGNLVIRSMQSRYNDGVNMTNFLPMGNNYQYSKSSRRQRDFSINSVHDIVKISNSIMLGICPSFSYSYGKSWSANESVTMSTEAERDTALVYGRHLIGGSLSQDARQKMINASLSEAYNGDYNLSLRIGSDLTIKVPRSSDAIGFIGSYEFLNNHSNNESDYQIAYGSQSVSPMARHQTQKIRPNHTNLFSGKVFYRISLANETSLEFSYDMDFQRQNKNSAFYLGQLEAEATGDYTIGSLMETALDFDPSNSFNSVEYRLRNSIGMNFKTVYKRVSYFVKPSLSFYHNKLDYIQGENTSSPHFNKVMGDFEGSMQYNSKDRTTTALLSMVISPNTPGLIDMITPINTTDPLNVYLGNPDLKGFYQYSPSFFVSKAKFKVFNLYFRGSLTFTPNSITKGYAYDTTTGVRYHKSYNISGNMSGFFGAGIHWRFRKFNLTYSIGYNNARNYTMIGENLGENQQAPQRSRMINQTLTNELKLSYEPSSNFKVDINYNPRWQWAHNQQGASFDIREDKLGLHITAKLPYNWSLKTGMDMYSRHGYGDKDMDTADWIWNTRITKSFQKGRWVMALDAYDLLHQMKAVTYSISPQCRIEKFTNTIPRYILFHVQYRINIMPKKDSVKKQEKVMMY